MANTATSLYTASPATDYIILDFNPATQLNTYSWTIELWMYNPTGYTMSNFNGTHGFYIAPADSNDIYLNNGGRGASLGPIGLSTTGGWQHVAIVRNNENAYAYLNGELKVLDKNARTTTAWGGGNVYLGRNGTDASGGRGHFDEIRFSTKARYGNFDTPTAYLSSHQTAGRGKNTLLPHHTVVHISSETATDGSTTFVDKSGTSIITATNSASHEDTYSLPWGNTAIDLTGTKYITAGSYANWPGNSNNWSLEMWYLTTGLNSSDVPFEYGAYTQSGSLLMQSYGGGDFRFFTGGSTPTGLDNIPTSWAVAGVWRHLAMVGHDGGFTFYVDGKIMASTTTQITLEEKDLRIGASIHGSAASSNMPDQYVDDVRLCVGQSAYTPNFIPYGGQKNVVHNRGGAVTDARLASANTHAIQMGRAAIGSDAATNANTYHLHFDGTDDYLVHKTAGGTGTTQYRPNDDRGTIFAWINPDVVNSHGGIFSAGYTGDTHTYFDFYLSSGAKLGMQQRENDTGGGVVGDTSLTAGDWQSVAVVSDGTAWALYVNGTAQSLTASGAANAGEWFADTPNLNNITIGTLLRTSAVDNFDGRIMQVAYFGSDGTGDGTNGVLTAAQIAALHSAGKGHDLTTATGVYTASEIDDLKGYWRMGNHYLDTAETIYDASGNGYDMNVVSVPNANTATGTAGTTYLPNWQHRGYFTPDKYTSLLIQSSTREGAVTFEDTGPGFKRMSFNGTSQYCAKISHTNYRSSDTVGSICAWVKIGAAKDNNGIFGYTDTGGSANYFYLSVLSDGRVNFQPVVSASSLGGSISGGSVPPGKWTMVTLTYDDTQYRIYVDGTEVSTYTNSLTGSADSTETWFNDLGSGVFDTTTIGALIRNSDAHFFDGQISQVAVWSATLTASQISGMYALDPGGNWNVSDYNTGLVDYWTMGNQTGEGDDLVTASTTVYSQVTSGNDLTAYGSIADPFAGHTITPSSAPLHKTDKSVFGGSSMYFDGSDDYLSIPSTPDLIFPTADFTFEFWVYYTSSSSGKGIFNHSSSVYNFTHGASNELYFQATSSSPAFNAPIAPQLPANEWIHVALTREDGYISSYINGAPFLSPTALTTLASGTGANEIGRHSSYYFLGYLDEFRISSGIARYTRSIERYANTFVAKGDTGDAFTALQIQSNGAKNGTGYSNKLNRTGYNTSAVTVAGNPLWKNTVGDGFGGANTALYFSGESDTISFADSAEWDLVGASLTNWTHEVWVYHDQATAYGSYIGQYEDTSNKWFFGANDYAWGQLYSGAVTNWTISNTAVKIPVYEWVHIVFQRRNGFYEQYMNGVLIATQAIYANDTYSGVLKIGDAGDPSWNAFVGYMDQIRLSVGIARYGNFQLRTTQQTHVSANSDSGVVTSNSTFGSANNILSTDGNTGLLLNADELYSNTHVSGSDNVFLMSVGDTNVSNVTTTFAITVGTGVRRDGASNNIYYINEFGRAPLTLVRDNHYIFQIDSTVNGNHPFKFSTTAGGTHSPGGTEYTTGITSETSGTNTLIKISPTSATPDSLHYYCSLHNNMGHTISVTDSTGSDGIVAPQPIGVHKGDKSTASRMPTQRQGISAYGANSFYFDGDSYLRTANNADLFVPHGDGVNRDYTMEFWMNLDAFTSASTYSGLMALAGYHGSLDGLAIYLYGQSLRPYLVLGGTTTDFGELATIQTHLWYHVAVQYIAGPGITGEYEVFLNGQKIHTRSYSGLMDDTADPYISMGAHTESAAGTYHYTGYLDGIRYSKGIARYKYSGTNAKLGTNAVHHSHAKLLITSNTFSGNTHFDDFSDQGNYWNQQPFSYFFDGTDDIINLPTIKSGYGVTGAVWFRSTALESQSQPNCNIYNLNLGARTGLHYLVKDSGTFSGTQAQTMALFFGGSNHLFTEEGQGTIPQENQEWHCAIAYHDSSDGSGATIYVDGKAVTLTNRGGSHGGSGTNAIGGLAGELFKGFISQVAFWDGNPISASEAQAIWEAGPTANWLTDYSEDMLAYYGMGNHNDLGGRPADTATVCYDRSGNGRDSSSISGTMRAPNKGTDITAFSGVQHSTNVKNFGSSSIFFDGTDDYLQIEGERNNWFLDYDESWTLEMWINMQNPTTNFTRLACLNNGSVNFTGWALHMDGTTGNLQFGHDSTSINATTDLKGNSASNITANVWHHIAIVHDDDKNSLTLFKDGKIAITRSNYNSTQPIQNWWTATDCTMMIGRRAGSPGYYYKGYMDEFAVYRGTAKYTPVVTGLGTSTVTPSYLDDPTGNHFTPVSLAITDQMLDSPENNFFTWSPLHKNTGTFKEGNLQFEGDGTQWAACIGSMLFKTGKWYFESKHKDNYGPGIGSAEGNMSDGWVLSPETTTPLSGWGLSGSPYTSGSRFLVNNSGFFYNFGTAENIPSGTDETDAQQQLQKNEILGFAFDLDNYRVKLFRNGNLVVDVDLNTTHTGGWYLQKNTYYYEGHGSYDFSTIENFGQGDPDGDNNFTDSNGRGGFRFEPPQGYLACCTANMKDADYAPIGPNSAAGTPDKHFDTVLYTGNVKERRIGGLNFQPDLVWLKTRGGDYHHAIFDSVRGVNKSIKPSNSGTEDTWTKQLMSFNSDGFTVGDNSDSGNYANLSANNYVGWCWKAGNETTVNNDGTIQSTVSVNQDAGFSIVSYTGIGSNTNTGHGLNNAPEWIMFKALDDVYNWEVYHHKTGATPHQATLMLNSSDATRNVLHEAVTATTIPVTHTYSGGSASGKRMIAYCWYSVEGYSKFGSFEGNNDPDGAFVYLGFKPAWVMVKNSGTAHANHDWIIFDNKRHTFNPIDAFLRANESTVETTSGRNVIDFLSNGFKARSSYGDFNSTESYVYMAFAEMPFKYANAG